MRPAQGHVGTVLLLLACGADANVTDRHGDTALWKLVDQDLSEAALYMVPPPLVFLLGGVLFAGSAEFGAHPPPFLPPLCQAEEQGSATGGGEGACEGGGGLVVCIAGCADRGRAKVRG